VNSSGLLLKAQSFSNCDDLEEISNGINAPFDIFNLICKKLNLNHAALLIEDSIKKEFFPIIYKNLDRTSATRLHIPSKKILDKKKKKNSQNIKRYLSYNDAQSISDYGIIDLSSDKIDVYIIYAISKRGSNSINHEFIIQNRDLLSQKILSFNMKENTSKRKKEIPPLFLIKSNKFITETTSRSKSFYIVFIDAKKTIEQIINRDGLPIINAFKIESEFYNTFANNIEGFGKLARINYGEYIIVAQLNNAISPELFIKHLDTSLWKDFNGQKKWKPLNINYNKYFQNIGTIEKATSLLLSKE